MDWQKVANKAEETLNKAKTIWCYKLGAAEVPKCTSLFQKLIMTDQVDEVVIDKV